MEAARILVGIMLVLALVALAGFFMFRNRQRSKTSGVFQDGGGFQLANAASPLGDLADPGTASDRGAAPADDEDDDFSL